MAFRIVAENRKRSRESETGLRERGKAGYLFIVLDAHNGLLQPNGDRTEVCVWGMAFYVRGEGWDNTIGCLWYSWGM